VLLAALMGFGWYAAPLTAATVAAEGPEVRVVGRLTLQLSAPDQREFMQKTLEMAAITRRQDQLTSYSCNGDIEDPGADLFDEILPSEAALQAQQETPHFKAWWSWVEPHLAGKLVMGISPTEAFHVV
jgi:quinol monooxygenase YgiN